MRYIEYTLGFLLLMSIHLMPTHQADTDEDVNVQKDADTFLKEVSAKLYQVYNIYNELADAIAHTRHLSGEERAELKNAIGDLQKFVDEAKQYENINNEQLKYALDKLYHAVDIFILKTDDVVDLAIHVGGLRRVVTNKNVQAYGGAIKEIAYDPDVLEELHKKHDDEIFEFYWKKWRLNSGFYAPKYLSEVVTLLREAAKKLELPILKYWNENFNEEFIGDLDEIMEQLKPLYQKVHTYARHKLFLKFGAGKIKPHSPIPEHLVDYWQIHTWDDNEAKKQKLNDNSLKVRRKYPVKELLKVQNFFISIGFDEWTDDFLQSNIIENKDFNSCRATVRDTTADVVVHYCNRTDFDTFLQYYDIVGRVNYALLKKDLPQYFFEGYNLKYAVGQATKLSALADVNSDTWNLADIDEIDNNFPVARISIFNIAKYYVLTKVMARLLDGTLQKQDVNKHYWSLMEEYAGIEPPNDRTDLSFDLPPIFYENINEHHFFSTKFVSEILGYQFYKALCQKTDYVGELYKCNLSGEKIVGDLLKEMLSLGSSKPWQDVIGVLLANDTKLDATALYDYYEPFSTFLDEYIKENKLSVGWEHTMRKFSKGSYSSIDEAKKFVEESSDKIYKLYDQLISDLFKGKYDNSDDQDKFWLLSTSAVAANELKDISLMAQTFNVGEEYPETQEALEKLSKIADIFVLGTDLDKYLKTKKELEKIATDPDLLRYNAENQEDFVSLYDVYQIYKNSSDHDELQHYWKTFRDENSEFVEKHLFEITESFTKAATILGVSVTQFWYKQYTSDLMRQMDAVIEDLKPMYEKLLGFLREELSESELYPISDHLYQMVLHQIWKNNSIIEKYYKWDELPPYDEFIQNREYDSLKILHEADKFYESLGLQSLDDKFWTERLAPQDSIEKDSEACHATVYDVTPTVYMKYCEQVNFKKFVQAYGYMGRVHYANEKHQLPAYHFDSYFLEYPVGEAVILSVSSPKYMQASGLSGDFVFTDNVRMNRLLRMGIHTLLNIHMYYVRTKVIHDYLENKVTKENLNKYYWKLMITYAGVEPPVTRKTGDIDFPYEFYVDLDQNHQAKKFVSEVLGYQFYEGLCGLSGHEGELNDCDFSGNKDVGEALQKMMQLGSSQSLPNLLGIILNSATELDASAILHYYEPLLKWLDEQEGIAVGYGTPYNQFQKATFIHHV